MFKIEQDHKTDDEKRGCSGFTNQKDVDPVNLKDKTGSGDKILPHPVKDVRVYLKKVHFFLYKSHYHLLSNRNKTYILEVFGNKAKQ